MLRQAVSELADAKLPFRALVRGVAPGSDRAPRFLGRGHGGIVRRSHQDLSSDHCAVRTLTVAVQSSTRVPVSRFRRACGAPQTKRFDGLVIRVAREHARPQRGTPLAAFELPSAWLRLRMYAPAG